MCGIAGFSGSFSPGLLEAMGNEIDHRGPDDQGSWRDPAAGIGLAHRRLSIIDLSPAGHQPMWDATSRAVIAFNGEIYNYRELRESLVRSGYAFRSQSDTEVLLNLYLRDGEAMLGRLNGIFAFALYDTASRTLFLARDGLGVKPLYYHQGSSGLLFASELKALMVWEGLDRSLDTEAIHAYMSFLWGPSPMTPFSSVRKLEPGYAMLARDGRITRHWAFYDLPYGAHPDPAPSPAEAAAQVEAAVAEAVRRQMVSDVPVGAFLSGGLDSSAVVAFARKHTSHRLQCFTIGFSGEAARREEFAQDQVYAARVAAHLGVDLHRAEAGPELADQLERMIWLLDEPQADPAPLNALLICGLARDQGIKVLLSGAGGDDIFTGYRRHQALRAENLWGGLPSGMRRALRSASRRLPQGRALGRRLAKAFRFAHLEPADRLCSYFLWNEPDLLGGLYGPLLRERSRGLGALAPLRRSLERLPGDVTDLDRMLYLEGKHFLADHNLNYTDRMGMAVGVEVRVPLLDPDLVALAAGLPDWMKQNGRTGKWIFRKAMEPHLPRDVIYRPKVGFGLPLRHWLRNELKPMADDLLSEGTLRNRGLFDPAGVAALRTADAHGRVDGTYALFAAMCMEIWCRLFADGSGIRRTPRGAPAETLTL